MPFVIIVSFIYWIVINNSGESNIDLHISVLGHFVALIFAIFIGYFAFIQVAENRLEKYKDQGFQYIKSRSYLRAKKMYEKAHIIDVSDFLVLANLLETYLFLEEYSNFNEKINALNDEVIDSSDKIVVYYLKIAKYLLQEDLGDAKSQLSDFISYVKDKPESIIRFSWDFSDIVRSDPCEKLNWESRTMLDNFRMYLTKSLDGNKKEAFENWDYTLSSVNS